MRILFWNIGKGGAWQALPTFVVSNSFDVIILAECSRDRIVHIVVNINKASSSGYYRSHETNCERVVLISRYSQIRSIGASDRYAILQVKVPLFGEVLVVAVHLPSKLYATDIMQYYVIRQLRAALEEAEEICGHQKTIVIGDFNINPFEDAMVAVDGLNAVMTVEHLDKAERSVRRQKWTSFYNPMWSFFGDRSAGPPGSYFYASSEVVCYYWNIFDQVLLRAELAKFLSDNSVQIHKEICSTSMVVGAVIDHQAADHLPISLEISIEGNSQ